MTRWSLTAGLFLLLSLGRPSWGATEPTARNTPPDVLVAYDVTLESGKTISLVSRLGELSQLNLEGGKILAVGLSLEETVDQVVSFRLLEGRQQVAGAELSWKQVEKFSLRPGATYTTAWKPTISFHLKSLKPTPEPGHQALSGSEPVKLIAYEVTTPSQKGIKLVGRAGEMSRIEGADYLLGVIPEVRNGSAAFRVFKFHTAEGGKEIPKEVENFTLLPGDARVLKVQPAVTLRLTSIKLKG